MLDKLASRAYNTDIEGSTGGQPDNEQETNHMNETTTTINANAWVNVRDGEISAVLRTYAEAADYAMGTHCTDKRPVRLYQGVYQVIGKTSIMRMAEYKRQYAGRD